MKHVRDVIGGLAIGLVLSGAILALGGVPGPGALFVGVGASCALSWAILPRPRLRHSLDVTLDVTTPAELERRFRETARRCS